MNCLRKIIIAVAVGNASVAVAADDDLLRMQSARGFDETVLELREGLTEKGLTVFAEIDHAGAAAAAGLDMSPTKVLIFGNPKAGTPVMLNHPDVALDLPFRLLVREAGGTVQVLMHKIDSLAIPDDARARLRPAETLVRALVEGK